MTNVFPLAPPEPAHFDAVIGRRVRDLIRGRATQAELGAVLGLGQSDVSKRLRGAIAWKAEELRRIADALGVSIAVVYGEEPPPAGDGSSVVHPPGLEPGTN
ncbi:helix-turn-helix domain-containing protein [Agrococcus jejuensis]|uniref:helix-turn-helix domain-containing protein n=1 Tax=Agrococcus jejuensis TaxID=399736 RepID=UPI0034D95C3E